MKLSAVAFDYDGTVASDGVLDPGVREALGELRRKGIATIVVTERSLDDLRRVAGDLGFVDAVVAENGAVLHFPGPGVSSVVGRPPDGEFLEALQSRVSRLRSETGWWKPRPRRRRRWWPSFRRWRLRSPSPSTALV